ncbi:exosporium protein ExsE [Bacillus carboniphilus]|uniref:Exosporium protein ExsE n=1 Tax=Bacillus carboniphilus TaxID=86663 RepID=A0ABP3FX09_9BACI
MRTWRVGTFSMGASLLILGITLLVSQFTEVNVNHMLVSWWPFIFIVLGVEVLLYLWLQRAGKERLRYDILSIFFVGMLGMVGLAFVVLSQIGITDYVERLLMREYLTMELPEYDQSLNDEIERVVVKSQSESTLTLETSPSSTLSIFGTYSGEFDREAGKIQRTEDYITATKKGDTLFVTIKKPARTAGPFSTYYTMNPTILIPQHVNLEVMGEYAPIILKPRMMLGDWVIKDSHEISVYLEKDHPIGLEALGVQQVSTNVEELKFEKQEDITEYGEEPYNPKNVSLFEESASGIHILNAYSLIVQQTP